MTLRCPESPPPKRPRLNILRPVAPPLPIGFLTKAAAMPGKTLAVAVAIFLLASAARSPTVTLGHWMRRRMSLSPDATFDALTRLAAAGLIQSQRCRGKHAEVTILDVEARALVTANMGSNVSHRP